MEQRYDVEELKYDFNSGELYNLLGLDRLTTSDLYSLASDGEYKEGFLASIKERRPVFRDRELYDEMTTYLNKYIREIRRIMKLEQETRLYEVYEDLYEEYSKMATPIILLSKDPLGEFGELGGINLAESLGGVRRVTAGVLKEVGDNQAYNYIARQRAFKNTGLYKKLPNEIFPVYTLIGFLTAVERQLVNENSKAMATYHNISPNLVDDLTTLRDYALDSYTRYYSLYFGYLEVCFGVSQVQRGFKGRQKLNERVKRELENQGVRPEDIDVTNGIGATMLHKDGKVIIIADRLAYFGDPEENHDVEIKTNDVRVKHLQKIVQDFKG